jgi:outer membrane lipoprotein-sorting protein
MAIRSTIVTVLLVCAAARMATCQSLDAFLQGLDQSSKNFNGAKATIHRTIHTRGIDDDDAESGDFFVKRDGSKSQIRIDFKEPNVYSVVINERQAEVYRPKLNETTDYDLRAYHDMAEKLFLLGFGMTGRELSANYEIAKFKKDTVDGEPCGYVELTPKSAEVGKKLKTIEVWISERTKCPARQIFHMPDGSWNKAEFSAMDNTVKLTDKAFDLPKAKHVKAN